MKKQFATLAFSLSLLTSGHALTPEINGYNVEEYSKARVGIEQIQVYLDQRAHLVEEAVANEFGEGAIFDIEDNLLKLLSANNQIQSDYVRTITSNLTNNETVDGRISVYEKEQIDAIVISVLYGQYGEAVNQLELLSLNVSTQMGKTIVDGLKQNNWASGYLQYVDIETQTHDMSSEDAGEAIGTVAGAYVGVQVGGSIGVLAGGPGGLLGGAVGGGGLGAKVGGAIGKLIGGLFGKKDKDEEGEGEGGGEGEGESEGFWLGERGDQPGCGQFGVNC